MSPLLFALITSRADAAAGPHHEQRLDPPYVPEAAARRPPGPATAGPDAWVYGYWPYWSGDLADLDWDRLSHVAIFSVDLNSDGSLSGTSYWTDNAAEAMALAEPYGVRVHLTLTCFDDDVMDSVLGSASLRTAAVDNLAELVDAYGAHGVSVDCEGMDSDLKDELVAFVAELSERVEEVTVATPAVDWSGAYDYSELARYATLFIMGYGYHWSSGDPGPVGPLYGGDPWPDWALDWSVDDYLSSGAPRDRIILGLPLYGRDWPSSSTEVPGTATGTGSAIVMAEAVSDVAHYTRHYDEQTETPYYFPDSYSQVWYDDTESIRQKIRYAVGEDLLGVGFWALNYEGNAPSFWDMVDAETRFAEGGTGGGGTGGGGTGGGDTGAGVADGDDTGAAGDTGRPGDGGAASSGLVADAGNDVLAYPGEQVFLSGYGSGASVLRYQWNQVAGTRVQLSDASAQIPSFTAPSEEGTLVFELIVYNQQGQSEPDDVAVVVARTDISAAFAAEAGGCGCGAAPGGGSAGLAGLLGLLGLARRRR